MWPAENNPVIASPKVLKFSARNCISMLWIPFVRRISDIVFVVIIIHSMIMADDAIGYAGPFIILFGSESAGMYQLVSVIVARAAQIISHGADSLDKYLIVLFGFIMEERSIHIIAGRNDFNAALARTQKSGFPA